MAQSSIGLELNIPLFSGGMTQSKVRESTERLYQTQSEQEDLRREVALKTRNYHRAINSDIEQVIARRQNIRSNQKSLEANKVGLEFGSRNIVDVVNAQRQLYSAVRDYNNSRYDYILNTLNLKQAAGTLSPNDLAYLSNYLSKNHDPERDFLPPEMSEQDHNSRQSRGEEQLNPTGTASAMAPTENKPASRKAY
ncbi:Outer membrane protein TolC precursor [compost metagenome]